MTGKDVFLSVVTRVRNVADTIGPALHGLIGVMEARFGYYEIVVVDDASNDGTRAVIEEIQRHARNIQLYALARTRGPNVALTAGLDHAIGDLIVTIDLDVDPPELIPELVARAVDGVEVVYALPRDRLQRRGLYNNLVTRFVGVLSRVNRMDIPNAVSGYRLFSRAVLNFMLAAPDRHRTLMLLPAISGYPHATVPYERRPAVTQRRRAEWFDTLMRALDLMLSSSTRPLRVVTMMSLGISVLAFIYAIYVVFTAFLKHDVAAGWASLSLQICGLFFLVCIILAVMSEYLLQVLEISRGTAHYHIAHQSHSATLALARERNVLESAQDSAALAPDGVSGESRSASVLHRSGNTGS